jgi:hypothetical protein
MSRSSVRFGQAAPPTDLGGFVDQGPSRSGEGCNSCRSALGPQRDPDSIGSVTSSSGADGGVPLSDPNVGVAQDLLNDPQCTVSAGSGHSGDLHPRRTFDLSADWGSSSCMTS